MFNLSKEFESVIEHIPFGRVQELAFGDQAPVETKEQEESEVKIEDMQVEKNQEEEENIDIEQPKEPQGNISLGTISIYGKIWSSIDRRTR